MDMQILVAGMALANCEVAPFDGRADIVQWVEYHSYIISSIWNNNNNLDAFDSLVTKLPYHCHVL